MSVEEPVELIAVREDSGAFILVLSTGEELEVATTSMPADLPELGVALAPRMLTQLREAAERKIIARRLFSLLDRRQQPRAKLIAKLEEKGHDPDAVAGVLDRMQEQGIHSDRAYAEAWCRDCLLQRAVGRRYLVDKLRIQRVDVEIARAAADAVLDSVREQQLAFEAAARRWRRTRLPSDPADHDGRRKAEAKVIRFLQGRGFSTGLAVTAMRETKPESDLQEDEEAQ